MEDWKVVGVVEVGVLGVERFLRRGVGENLSPPPITRPTSLTKAYLPLTYT